MLSGIRSGFGTPIIAMLPPTSQLPPIRKLAAFSIDHLIGSVRYLRKIYNPQVRGITRRKDNLPLPSAGRDSLDELRTDSFERTYAIKWLTALIGHFSSTEERDPPLNLDLARLPSISLMLRWRIRIMVALAHKPGVAHAFWLR